MYSRWNAGPAARVTRAAISVLLAVLAVSPIATPAYAADPPTHAAWVPATSFESPDGIRRAITAAVAAGIGTIVAPAPLYHEGGPDRFMELVQQAHEHQLLVFASIDVDRATAAGEVPVSRNHVIYQHPEWLMVPRALAPELLTLDTRSPEYVGRLARWTRTNGLDGVYLSPLPDEAPGFVAARVASVLKRYPIDGVQLDAARYPGDDFDYGREAIEAFRQNIRPSLSGNERVRVDGDESLDPFAYPNAFPDAWRRFRQTQLTRLVQIVRTAIAATTPGIPVIAAVSGAVDTDLQDHFQDWRTWVEKRLIDAVSIRSGSMTTIVADPTSLVTVAEAGATSTGR
jgi:uncharacterized lipoprotein YddW (UPF0748 family)